MKKILVTASLLLLIACTQEQRDRLHQAAEEDRARQAACDADPVCAEDRRQKSLMLTCEGDAVRGGMQWLQAEKECEIQVSGTPEDKQLLEMQRQTKIMQQNSTRTMNCMPNGVGGMTCN